ncbi:LysR family transcriptional regulator [Pectobacterium punjabense]|uniref:LysR family transcriptional regulator n=1 Tax=Pectobacterium punjabense TaxID=2108399 RepID=A0ABX6KWR8_9GAMM|nr:LysR family transcriptional regulator [Pectobacterium punjabense]MBS4429661.1 LysR family transcriptional regulator [Pectobacterium punjabense]MDG0798612.1 LysR family transcriptional regulator [Pectobacterium punjabense]PTA65054.1 transcriptional regulator [Pectobacterium punjabense]QJA18567.1 LysR family transcriptional regulator [Pectobacterium punjabense]
MIYKNKLVNDWVIFYTVVECGSLSLAATKLGTSVSTISKSIAKTESLLGSTLLRRSSRGIEMTNSGHSTYKKAKSIVSSIYSLLSEIGDDTGVIRGKIRFSAPNVMCENIANQWIFDYINEHKEVCVDLFSRERSDLSVSSPEFDDLVLKSGFMNSPDLVHCKLTPMPLVMCASPDYLNENDEVTDPHDLNNHGVLMLNHPSLAELTFMKEDENIQKTININARLISNNVAAIVNLALEGKGICVASPYWFIRDYLNSGKLKMVLPDWKIPTLDTYLVWRYREYQSPLMISFRKYIQQKWEELSFGECTQ